MASLPISNSCGKSFVTSTGSASASMSLTSVSPITGRGVLPSLHTRPDGQSNDRHPSLRHNSYFSVMSDLAAPVSSRAWTCSPAISSYIQNGDSTATSGPLKPYVVWLDTETYGVCELPSDVGYSVYNLYACNLLQPVSTRLRDCWRDPSLSHVPAAVVSRHSL